MAFVNDIRSFIHAFHVHDNNGIADTHQPIQPGSWVLDMLKKPEFSNLPIVVESKFSNIADLSTHVKWLKEEI